MEDFFPFLMWLFVFPLVLILGFVYGTGSSFGQRCTEAGYTGAQHEACVIRLVNGGTLYEENMHLKEKK